MRRPSLKMLTAMCLACIFYANIQDGKLNRFKDMVKSVVSNKELDDLRATSWRQPAKGISGDDLDDEETCRPVINIAYAKIHKTGSTAIQGILVRYGVKHKLTFVLPTKWSTFPMTYPFNREMVSWQTMSGLFNFNIFAIHCKWNMEEIRKLMPPDTIFIASVRKPVDLFVSSYEYSNLKKRSGMKISEFIQKKSLRMIYQDGQGYNQMLRDFGVSGEDVQNIEIVQNKINYLDKNFDLVLVNEKMKESLVLLRHLLCWEPKDMVTFQVNARREEVKFSLGDKLETLLQKRLQPDTLLYNHFNDKMESLIRNFGEEKMRAEVQELKEAVDEVQENCSIKEAEEKALKKGQKLGPRNIAVGLSGKMDTEECKLFSFSEPYLIDYVRKKQIRMTTRLNESGNQ